MPTIVIRDKQTGQEFEGSTGTPFDTSKYELVDSQGYDTAEERPPGEGVRKPGFLQGLGQDVLETVKEAPGRALKDVRRDVGDVVRVGSSMVPGPLGALTAGAGSLAGDVIQGEDPSFSKAGLAAGETAVLGGLGKILAPLARLRVAGTGKTADAARAARAVRGAGTSLQPGDTVADLAETMRGTTGSTAMGAAKEAGEAGIAAQLPSTPPVTINTPISPGGPQGPPLSREAYESITAELTKLGRQGFVQGQARSSPAAVAARERYGEVLADLKAKIQAQGGAPLLNELEGVRRDFSAGTEMRRQFRGNTGEGPDRVFRPGGFNMQDLQERAVKRLPEIEGRLGQPAAREFFETLLRGGKPGQGTDRPLALSSSKFGGFRIPTGLQILAGQGIDPKLLQMLLQGGGAGLTTGLSNALRQ